MEEKVKIIKEIVKFHPGYGTEIGYSWYRGGLGDTGDWYWDKMIDEPKEKLKSFLEKLQRDDENNKRIEEEEKKLREELGRDEYYKRQMEIQNRLWEEHFQKEEIDFREFLFFLYQARCINTDR